MKMGANGLTFLDVGQICGIKPGAPPCPECGKRVVAVKRMAPSAFMFAHDRNDDPHNAGHVAITGCVIEFCKMNDAGTGYTPLTATELVAAAEVALQAHANGDGCGVDLHTPGERKRESNVIAFPAPANKLPC